MLSRKLPKGNCQLESKYFRTEFPESRSAQKSAYPRARKNRTRYFSKTIRVNLIRNHA